jgi:nucleoside 2-deoxyribosyltransferase
MKRIYVCGSFRFIRNMESLENRLKEEKIEYRISKSLDSHGIMGCLRKIDEADVVYIFNPGGYVGKSVSVDIGYAYARGKSIYAMNPVEDPPVADLITGILSPESMVRLVKESSAAVK